jgi:RNA 2',3'-cyclic 3'-phosphodiesterase
MSGRDEAVTRLFVAAWPSPAACDHVRSLPRDGWVNVRWTPEDTWHVTLAFLGEREIAEVIQQLECGDYRPATAEIGARMRVLGGNSLVVPVDGLDALAAAVRTHVFDGPPKQPFRGHLTVARSIGKRPISGKSRTGQVLAPLAFDVKEIALVRSTLSPQGARYDTVGTFACR